MVRKGSRSSASTPSTSRDSSCKQKALIGGGAETIMLLLKNLAATTSAVVARLDRLEGAPFDARGPADFGAAGSTTIETPESIIKVCSSALVSSSTGPWSAGDVPTAECEQAPPPAPAHPSPQTVVDYIETPPTAARLFNCLNLEQLILTVGLWRWRKTMAVAASSVSFSSVPCLVSTVPFPMTSPYMGRGVTFFLNQAQILSRCRYAPGMP